MLAASLALIDMCAQVTTESAATRSPGLLSAGNLTLNCPFGLLPFVFEVELATRTGHNHQQEVSNDHA